MKAYYTNGDNFHSLVGQRVMLHLKTGGCFAGKLVMEHKHLRDKVYMDTIVFVGFCPFHMGLENNNPYRFNSNDEAYTDADVLNYKTSICIAEEDGEVCYDTPDFILEINDNLRLWDAILKENIENFDRENIRLKKEFDVRFNSETFK